MSGEEDTCPSCGSASDYPRAVDIRLLLPVQANDGRPLAPKVLERYLGDMADRWGGVTVEKHNGCFRSSRTGGLDCEPGLTAVSTVEQHSLKQGRADDHFSKALAKRVGDETGQEAVLEVETRDLSRTFVKGRRRMHLSEDKLAHTGVAALLA